MKSAPCRGCGYFSHWSKDAVCQKNAGKAAHVVGVASALVAEGGATGAAPAATVSGDMDAMW